MIRNFFITAIRNFRKNLSHTLLNIAGLGLGLACCLVVFTIINFEYSFDNWHEKKDRIYRVTNIYHGDNRTSYNGIINYPTGKAIRDNVPDLEKVVEFHGPQDEKFSFTDSKGQFQVFREEGVLMTNRDFFDVLDFKLLAGDVEAIEQPNKIYLSQELAEKYFGNEDPIGKTLRFQGETNLDIAGVIENSPDATNLPYTCIISIETLRQTEPNIWTNWGMTWAYSVYVLTKPNADIIALNTKIDDVIDGFSNPDDDEEQAKTEVALQPLLDIHNEERYGDGYNYVAPGLMIWAFVFLGALILGTACLNFINISTAQAISRSREVGIRKTLGSSKTQLVTQFLTEAFVIVLISMMIAISLGQFLLEKFNEMLTSIGYNLVYTDKVMAFALLLAIGVTILAGFYPSMILSGYQPVEALKNKVTIKRGSGSFNLRRSLVIAQFAFTTIMLIGTLIISAQVNFMKNKDLGFDFTNVVTIETPDESEVDPNGLLDKLKTRSYVTGATLAFTSPLAGSNWNTGYKVPGEEFIDGNSANFKFIDEEYLDFYKIELITGTNTREQFISDSVYDVLVTQHLLSTLGWKAPEEAVGRTITSGGGRNQYKIIGVVNDFNVSSAHNEIRPSMLMYRPEMMHQIAVRLPNDDLSEHIGDIEATFREFYPNELFEFEILKSQINERYLIEDILHTVIRFVSLLAILLSVMGLYGLISFMANRNAKTIGIRKVFGATTASILSIFTKEYAKLMLVSFIFAAPASYYLMDIWIQEFAFRIPLSISFFIAGFLITLVIALITVGYRSFKAARANPIQSLRYE
ncbi:MAG: ABC transporter permease [Cyclobacteriaceae bacterium]